MRARRQHLHAYVVRLQSLALFYVVKVRVGDAAGVDDRYGAAADDPAGPRADDLRPAVISLRLRFIGVRILKSLTRR